MLGFLRRIVAGDRAPTAPGFAPPMDAPFSELAALGVMNAPFRELGALGTQAFVVTDWQPGPTTWRPVNRADATAESLRRTYSTRGPLVLHADQTLFQFQGEKTPAATPGQMSNASDYIDAYANAMRDSGYPG